MSGGSLDYGESRITNIADTILEKTRKPLHVALAKHLYKVAKAVHDLEWMLSGDTSPGDEVKAIKAVVTKTDELVAAKEEAEKVLADLQEAIESASLL